MAGFQLLASGIAGLRVVAAESSHVFPRHTHEEFGIGVMLAGGQISASGRGQVTAEPRDVITVNPGEVHDGAPVGQRPRRWAMFYLSPELLADYTAGLRGAAGEVEFELPVIRHPMLSSGLSSLYGSVGTEPAAGRAPVLEERLLQLLSLVIRPTDAGRPSAAGARLKRAIAMIDDDPTANPSLQRLAGEAGLTRFQTLRAFARATGFTPHAYLMQRRFDLARRLMATPSGLAEVAVSSGYADQSHMTREFKRRYGITPAAYRAALHPAIPFKTEPTGP